MAYQRLGYVLRLAAAQVAFDAYKLGRKTAVMHREIDAAFSRLQDRFRASSFQYVIDTVK